MAGKIIADQIEHSTAGSLDTQYVVNGSAKAWANLNGSTFGLRKSLNIASAVDNGVGDYTFSFTSAMIDANYAALVTCSRDDTVNGIGNIHGSSAAPTSSALRITGRIPTTAGAVDTAFSNASIHGDLA